MHYVMSDLHGQYDLYRKMMEQLPLSAGDTLYVLGDVLDRGPHPIQILLDMMERPNVVFLWGNHEQIGFPCLRFLTQEHTGQRSDPSALDLMGILRAWQEHSGQTTVDEFLALDRETRRAVVDYLEGAKQYQTVKAGGKTYILVHGGLGNFASYRPLWDYSTDELVWSRPDYEVPYFTDHRYVVAGHTPTQTIPGCPAPGYIFRKNHHIAIDCGAFLPEGRLGCLRLEDEREFYVDH